MTRKQPKARCRIHRAFLKWMQENRHRFLVTVNIRHLTDRAIELAFAGYPPVISAWLSNRCIDVPVNWQGRCWDLLCSFESAPSPVTGGYHCLLYSPEDRKIFSSREELWTSEVFEPFFEMGQRNIGSNQLDCLVQIWGLNNGQALHNPAGSMC